ncbi:MAG: riboflavin biosynthesis protein RibF [Chloroflexia bacterium]|nr:riboflavin biosynthesis protein RibF [Chloroflexia bacterium]MDQ3512527.1 riboflavin biosynthesis protein RibF [Chloroflexota bacterium]
MVDDRTTVTFRSLAELQPFPRVITIGTFDGVHRGHQWLLRSAADRARDLDIESLAITFEPLPAMVLRPDRFPGRLCGADEKVRRIAACDVNAIAVLGFSRDFSEMTAEAFLTEVAAHAHPVEMLVGEAFALGRDRAGTTVVLAEIADRLGFGFTPMPRLLDGDTVISSSAIRQAVMSGDVAKTRRLLGRPFRLSGPVIHGAHLGRTIGFPTANVEPASSIVAPADGIYASRSWLPGESTPRLSMTYVGQRPTVNRGARLIETHLLDFDGDLYGRELRVDLMARIRDDAHFDSLDELVSQLHRDERSTRSLLGGMTPPAAERTPAGDISPRGLELER